MGTRTRTTRISDSTVCLLLSQKSGMVLNLGDGTPMLAQDFLFVVNIVGGFLLLIIEALLSHR